MKLVYIHQMHKKVFPVENNMNSLNYLFTKLTNLLNCYCLYIEIAGSAFSVVL